MTSNPDRVVECHGPRGRHGATLDCCWIARPPRGDGRSTECSRLSEAIDRDSRQVRLTRSDSRHLNTPVDRAVAIVKTPTSQRGVLQAVSGAPVKQSRLKTRDQSAIEADGQNSPSELTLSNQTRNSKHAAKDLAENSHHEIYADDATVV